VIERARLSKWELKARRWRRARRTLAAIAGWLDESLMLMLWSVFLGLALAWLASIWMHP
jgi:hypothetical protein